MRAQRGPRGCRSERAAAETADRAATRSSSVSVMTDAPGDGVHRLDLRRARDRHDHGRTDPSATPARSRTASRRWRAATSVSVGSVIVRRRRAGPPSGRYARSRSRWARQVLGHTAENVLVVPDAQLDLDRVDLGDPSRFLDLADRHVAETDRVDEAVAFQGRQRADARRQRCSRIRRVQLIQMDALDAERAPAVFASPRRCLARPSASQRPSGRVSPPLVATCTPRSIAAPRRERPGDEPFVVTALGVVPAVRVGGVEKGHAGVECRVQHGETRRVVAIGLGREAHAPKTDAWKRRHAIGNLDVSRYGAPGVCAA